MSNRIDDAELAILNGLQPAEVQLRRRAGHRPYVGFMHGVPAAYGWVGTREAAIGELGLSFPIPSGDRYLWDFATRPQWQGRGLYPRLLTAIIARELVTAQRFWIIHAPENLPSGAGISRALFTAVGELSYTLNGAVGLLPTGDRERARAGADLLGVPLVDQAVTPCWRCGPPAESGQEQDPGCTCRISGVCTCAQPLRSSRPALTMIMS